MKPLLPVVSPGEWKHCDTSCKLLPQINTYLPLGGVSGRSRHTADNAGEEVGVLKYIGLGYDFSLAIITPATLLNRPSGPPVSTLADLLGCAKVNRCNF